jgi:MFS family permease
MTESPFRSRNFQFLWLGQLVSAVGDQIFPIAIIALALGRDDAAFSIGVVFSVRFLALALFIVVGGVLADRFPKIPLMMGTDILRGLAVTTLVVVGTSSPLWVVALITFVLGTGEALFQPLYDASIPELVDSHQLQRANGASSMLQNGARVIGPAAAGLLVAAVGPSQALIVDVVSFAVSAATLVLVRPPATAPSRAKTPDEAGDDSPMWSDALAGIGVVVRLRWLLTLEVMAVFHVLFAVGPWFVLVPLVAVERLGGIGAYGVLLACFSLGGLPGAYVASRFHSPRPGLWGLVGLMAFGGSLAGLALTASMPALASLFAFAGFGTQFFDVLKTTAIQAEVPRRFLGRVFALDFFASFVTMPLGQLLAGTLVSESNVDAALLIAAAVIFATTLLPLLMPEVSSLRTHPRPVDQEPQAA